MKKKQYEIENLENCNRQLNIIIFSSCKPGLFWWGFFQFSTEISKKWHESENLGNCISATQNDFLYLQTRCGPDDVAKVPIANVILSTFISVKAICMLQQFFVKLQQKKLIDLNVEKISTWKKSKIISYCVAMLFRQTALCHYSPNTKNQIPKAEGQSPGSKSQHHTIDQ